MTAPELWDAVAELESQGYTKREICDMLDAVWMDLFDEEKRNTEQSDG